MVGVFLISILSVYFFLGFKKIELFIYLYIPINFLYDLVAFYLPDDNVYGIIRGFLFFLLLIYLLSRFKLPRTLESLVVLILLFVVQISLVSIFSTNKLKSYSELLKFINYIGFFFVGYQFINSRYGSLYKLLSYTRVVLDIMIINVALSNIFRLGAKGYSYDSIYTGGLYANGWYAPVIVLVIQLIVAFSPQAKKIYRNLNRNKTLIALDYATIALSIILVLLGGRRSAVLIIAIAIALFIFYNRFRLQSLSKIIIVFAVLLIFKPIYFNVLSDQYQNRLEFSEEGLDKENRWVETELLWPEMLSFTNIPHSLFGKNPFDTQGNYGSGFLGRRYLHVDINIILFSTGFLGLFIYVIFYFKLFSRAKLYFEKYSRARHFDSMTLKIIFFSVFFSSVVLSFSGGFSAITYRSTTFIILGAILGHLKTKNRKKKLNEKCVQYNGNVHKTLFG